MSHQYIRQFLVFGNSLTASMTVLALSKSLPKNIKLTWIKPTKLDPSDVLFGGISSPEAYPFNLQHDVSEPELVLHTDTTFTFGTHFQNWGNHHRSWMQCFHLPFTATSGVDLQHFMTRHSAQLQDFLISAQAALKGTFAHPPIDKPESPLSRAEYGYHFSPAEWSSVFTHKIDVTRVNIVSEELASVEHSQNKIDYVHLEDGTKIKADLFIDCSGTDSRLLSLLVGNFNCQRRVQIKNKTELCVKTGPACRSIKGTESGWEMVTPLRGKNHIVTLFESSYPQESDDCQTFELGSRNRAWIGNCIGIGQSAYAFEPLTPIHYMLVKKDIERLLELIPVNDDIQIERQEYNRRYLDDISHSELFHQAIYQGQRDVGYSTNDKLERKLTQYSHRGILTNYDFEPFNKQDWIILHAGLQRTPGKKLS